MSLKQVLISLGSRIECAIKNTKKSTKNNKILNELEALKPKIL